MYDRHLPKTNDVAAWTTCNAQLPAHLRHIQSSMQALSSLSRDRMGPCCHLGRRQHTSHRPSTCSFDSAGHRFGQGSQAQQYGDSITKNTTRNLWGGPLQTQTPQQHSMPLQSTPQPLLGAHPPLKYAQASDRGWCFACTSCECHASLVLSCEGCLRATATEPPSSTWLMSVFDKAPLVVYSPKTAAGASLSMAAVHHHYHH